MRAEREPHTAPGPVSEQITAIAYGPATPADIEAEHQAQLAATQSLENVRAAATKWAETIAAFTGLLGIGAVIKGRDDIADLEPIAQVLIAVFFLAALYFAGRAIMLAATAAQGEPTDNFFFTGRAIKAKNLADAKVAGQQLNESREVTIVAVIFLVVAVGITWFAPEEKADPKPPKALVTFTTGAPICGELALDESGEVAVTQAETPVAISDGNVSSVNVVSACPEGSDDED